MRMRNGEMWESVDMLPGEVHGKWTWELARGSSDGQMPACPWPSRLPFSRLPQMQLGLVDSPILPPLHTRAASEGEKPVFSMLDISNEFHSLLAFHLYTDLGGRIGKCCRKERFKKLSNMCIVQVN
jgi:hypothetical protein